MSESTIIQHRWDGEFRLPKDSPLWPYVGVTDLVFADPPYNYSVNYADDPTRDQIDRDKYRSWVHGTMFLCMQLLRPGGMLWWLCPAEDGEWVWNLLRPLGSLFQGKPVVWHETFSQYQAKRLTSDYRLLFPVVNSGRKITNWKKVEPTFYPNEIREKSARQLQGDKRANPDGRVPGHVWACPRLPGNARARVDWHPAQLHPAPLERIVRGWTSPGDLVVDAFAGSGSLGVVCKRERRRFVGVEGSPTYCELIRKRIEEAPCE